MAAPTFGGADVAWTLRSICKRWPRLALACMLSTVVALVLMTSVGVAPGLVPLPASPSLGAALYIGSVGAFVDRSTDYSLVLWSIRPELIGSLIVLAVAPLLLNGRSPIVFGVAVTTLATVLQVYDPLLESFVVGAVIARWSAVGMPRVSGAVALALVTVAACMFRVAGGVLGTLSYEVGSGCLIVAALGCPALASALSRPWGAFLGRISFPVYLIHTSVLVSFGAEAFGLWATTSTAVALLDAGLVTILGTLLLAVPLAFVDEAWVRLLGRVAARVVPPVSPRLLGGRTSAVVS